jgi:hypothetical protein
LTIRKSVYLLLLSAASAMCADQGSISGKILSAAGKGTAVPNAPVEARNLDTKTAYKAAPPSSSIPVCSPVIISFRSLTACATNQAPVCGSSLPDRTLTAP